MHHWTLLFKLGCVAIRDAAGHNGKEARESEAHKPRWSHEVNGEEGGEKANGVMTRNEPGQGLSLPPLHSSQGTKKAQGQEIRAFVAHSLSLSLSLIGWDSLSGRDR